MYGPQIIKALETLDVENDDHWTSDGAPRLDVLDPMLPGVARQHVRQAAPLFNRKNPVLPDLAAERESAEKAMREADDAVRVAGEAKQRAAQAARVVQSHEVVIRDHHTLTRENKRWIKSQLEQDALRAARQREIDKAIMNAGGLNQAGIHPIEKNIAARNKAARKNIVITAKKVGA